MSFIIIRIYSILVFVKMLKDLVNNQEINYTVYSETAIKAIMYINDIGFP